MFIVVLFLLVCVFALGYIVGYLIGYPSGQSAEKARQKEAKEREDRDRLLISMDDELKGRRQLEPGDSSYSFESLNLRRQQTRRN